MKAKKNKSDIGRKVHEFVTKGFSHRFGQPEERFGKNPVWGRLRQIGSELWLDTGDIKEAGRLWTQEFSALTTNNTLLNKEVQKGQYDSLVSEADKILSAYPQLSPQQRMLEIAFILNAKHGLRRSSDACRVCCMDSGTKGCVKHIILDADAACLCQLCQTSGYPPISCDDYDFCDWSSD